MDPSVAHTTASEDQLSQSPEAHEPSTQSTGDRSSNTQMAKVNSMKGITVNYTLNYGWSPTGTLYQNRICTPVMTPALFRAFVIKQLSSGIVYI